MNQSETFRLIVDYSQTPEQMMAAGHARYYDSEIKNVLSQIRGEGRVEFEARYLQFDFNKDNLAGGQAASAAKLAIETAGWENARIEHLLALGKVFSNEELKLQVVALGSTWGSEDPFYGYVPTRQGDEVRNAYWKAFWHWYWKERYWLAVREISRS